MNENKVHHDSLSGVFDAYTLITSFGARVILFVVNAQLTPEDLATLQAMYSRSNKPIIKRFFDLWDQRKLDDKKETIVGITHKGYGHASIGDLGNILICLEGVSMLCTKAVQDSQGYDGQESSTRYIPFDKQPFLVSENGRIYQTGNGVTGDLSLIQETWRDFYLQMLPIIQEALFEEYPWEQQEASTWEDSSEKETARGNYERAIKARAFDIIRGFLPAGCSTNLSWWTSIRHAADHLGMLRCHVLAEVREVAFACWSLLETYYPISFADRVVYQEREDYKTNFFREDYYLIKEEHISSTIKHNAHFATNIWMLMLQHWKPYLVNRPKGQEVPYQIGECGLVYYEALLDFASFRDQQRHRAVVQRQGLITSRYGFHHWYFDNLPANVKVAAVELLDKQLSRIDALPIDQFEKQYLFPMGMKIPTRIVGHLGKIIYMVELRAQKTVHPTYHANAYDLAQQLQSYLSRELNVESIPLYVDPDVGGFSRKRGGQTLFVAGKDISAEN
jgi:thymidylate synthase ThyX